jgi:quinol-cytochrome oxidoreductase complex cytochrome b subunit
MTEETHPKDEKTIPFFPDHITTEAWVTVGLLVIVVGIGVWAMFQPIGLEEPANAMDTPPHVKAHWYFLFLQEMLKYIPKGIGVVIPVVAIAIMALWPFIDSRPDSKRARTYRVVVSVVALSVIGLLTYLGATG